MPARAGMKLPGNPFLKHGRGGKVYRQQAAPDQEALFLATTYIECGTG
jgi:hypothetical protein